MALWRALAFSVLPCLNNSFSPYLPSCRLCSHPVGQRTQSLRQLATEDGSAEGIASDESFVKSDGGHVMRHSRNCSSSGEVQGSSASAIHRWFELSDDPNDPSVLRHRAQTLRDAWRPPVANRISFLLSRCKDKTVLDIGCVAHDLRRMANPNWLHRQLAAVAKHCVGVDNHAEGITQMHRSGFNAVCADITLEVDPLLKFAPFEVIIAGELIEHVDSLGRVFEVAKSLLAQDGELILTTPNPYAPRRIRAGQRGYVWENVDHITYAFPSGIAELSERHSLQLVEAFTDGGRVQLGGSLGVLRMVKRWIFGRGHRIVGFTSTQVIKKITIRRSVWQFIAGIECRHRRFVGETSIYVIRPRKD